VRNFGQCCHDSGKKTDRSAKNTEKGTKNGQKKSLSLTPMRFTPFYLIGVALCTLAQFPCDHFFACKQIVVMKTI